MKFEEVLYTQKAYHHKPTFLPTRATAKSAGLIEDERHNKKEEAK